jgi:hypothetical protein
MSASVRTVNGRLLAKSVRSLRYGPDETTLTRPLLEPKRRSEEWDAVADLAESLIALVVKVAIGTLVALGVLYLVVRVWCSSKGGGL